MNYLSLSLLCCSLAAFNCFAAQKEEKEKTTDAKVVWHNQLVECAKNGDIESTRALCNTATVKISDAASTISGYADVAEFLNSKHSGTCALISAAECGQLEMVQFLLTNKAHPMVENANEQNAFLAAAQVLESHKHEWQKDKVKTYRKMIFMLLDAGVNSVLANSGIVLEPTDWSDSESESE